MNSLKSIAAVYGTGKSKTDKGVHGFLFEYEKLFSPVRNKVKNILEIGIGYGNSLRMWRDYFQYAQVYGLDIRKKLLLTGEKRIKTAVVNQDNRAGLKTLFSTWGEPQFDIIIDDGSHKHQDQQITLGFLFKYLTPGGYYVIEDLHTAFDPAYGLPVGDEDTTYNTFIRDFAGHNKYMLLDEHLYLVENMKQCQVFNLDFDNSIMGVIEKCVK